MGRKMTAKTPAETERQEIFDQTAERLAEVATRFVTVLGHTPTEGAMVAIHVDDPEWTELAEILMPGIDWQPFRDRGAKPIAQGSVMWGTVEVICARAPDIAVILTEAPPEGHLYALVMAGGGVAVYAVPYRPMRVALPGSN